MFIRRVFQGEHTACVTSKLCLEGIGATVPDLQVNRVSERVIKVGQGKESRTEIFWFWLPLYMWSSHVATLSIELSSWLRVCTREGATT